MSWVSACVCVREGANKCKQMKVVCVNIKRKYKAMQYHALTTFIDEPDYTNPDYDIHMQTSR